MWCLLLSNDNNNNNIHTITREHRKDQFCYFGIRSCLVNKEKKITWSKTNDKILFAPDHVLYVLKKNATAYLVLCIVFARQFYIYMQELDICHLYTNAYVKQRLCAWWANRVCVQIIYSHIYRSTYISCIVHTM